MTPIGQLTLEAYLKNRKPLKFRTRLQEIVEPFLKYLAWSNETLPDDMRLLWITLNTTEKSLAEIKSIFEWARDKNSLHPKQVIKILTKRKESLL